MRKESGFTWKLGMFVMIGISLFVFTVYFIGKNKNLFGSTFHLSARFKNVSGLKVGNNVRFSGINVGTVDGIELVTDSTVLVTLLIKKNVQQFIKTDAKASIASDGLMGDKVLTISPGPAIGSPPGNTIKNNDLIISVNAIEMDDIMKSVKTSVDNAAIITAQLAEFSYKMNNGNGVLSKLTTDQAFSNSLKNTLANLQNSSGEFSKFTTKLNNGRISEKLDSTMSNLQSGTKGLSDNMEAAKHSFLLKGFFRKKQKADAKKLAESKKQQNTKTMILDSIPVKNK